MVGGVFVCLCAAYGTTIWKNYRKDVELSKNLSVPVDVSDRYNETAPGFDVEVDTMEKLIGIKGKRRKLAEKAKGHILEASVGTGRNTEFYKTAKSFTFVDQSPEMIKIAREKFAKLRPDYTKAVFRTQSAAEPMPTPPGGFDTIVQTMGLCSTPDPVALLRNLGSLANQEKGQILLLEHGRSYYRWLNTVMDNLAPLHADKHGCWWNRDILKIVEESGLNLVESRRSNFGTTYWLELRPKMLESSSESPSAES